MRFALDFRRGFAFLTAMGISKRHWQMSTNTPSGLEVTCLQ